MLGLHKEESHIRFGETDFQAEERRSFKTLGPGINLARMRRLCSGDTENRGQMEMRFSQMGPWRSCSSPHESIWMMIGKRCEEIEGRGITKLE